MLYAIANDCDSYNNTITGTNNNYGKKNYSLFFISIFFKFYSLFILLFYIKIFIFNLFLTKVVLGDLLDIFQETLQNVNLITITFQLEILQS